jgi:hypothetical protein
MEPVPRSGTAEFRDGFYEVKIPAGKSSFFCFVFFEEPKKMKVETTALIPTLPPFRYRETPLPNQGAELFFGVKKDGVT